MTELKQPVLQYENVIPGILRRRPNTLLGYDHLPDRMTPEEKRTAVLGKYFALFNPAWRKEPDTIFITGYEGKSEIPSLEVPNPQISFLVIDPASHKFGRANTMYASDIGLRPCPYGNHVTAVKWDFEPVEPSRLIDTNSNLTPNVTPIGRREHKDIGRLCLEAALEKHELLRSDNKAITNLSHFLNLGSWYNASVVSFKV